MAWERLGLPTPPTPLVFLVESYELGSVGTPKVTSVRKQLHSRKLMILSKEIEWHRKGWDSLPPYATHFRLKSHELGSVDLPRPLPL